MSRPGRAVLYERTPDVSGRRIVSLPVSLEAVASLTSFLGTIRQAQRFAEWERLGAVDLELLATVAHGSPYPHSYTLHFEVIPR
jgi:hypothetical protein